MPTRRTDATGLPREMPLAPGNRKASQPPRREEAGGALPAWLDPRNSAWPKDRIDAWDRRMQSRAGSYEVGEPGLKPIPGHRVA
jgi:hypothetical protein